MGTPTSREASAPRFDPHDVLWDAERVARFWDFYSSGSDVEYFSRHYASDLAKFIRRRVHPQGQVLDVGCGVGHLMRELGRNGVEVRGLDSSPATIAAARRNLPGLGPNALVVGSFTDMPIPGASVDVVTLVEVAEHVLDADLDAIFSEIRRVLRPGGRLVVTTPNNESLRAEVVECPDCGARFHSMQHVRSWTARSLTAALVARGYDRVRTYETRLIDSGPPWTRVARFIWYRLRRDRPHLIAVAVRP